MHHTVRFSCAAAALCAVLAACKDSTGPSINPVGTWHGTTSQSRPISFVVTADGITEYTLSYAISGNWCSYSAEATVGSSTADPVIGNSFSAEYRFATPGVGGANYIITGTFTSSTAAHGTLNIADPTCQGSVNGTWTATKG